MIIIIYNKYNNFNINSFILTIIFNKYNINARAIKDIFFTTGPLESLNS